MTGDCVICLKHQGKGPLTGKLIGTVDGFRIYHAKVDEEGRSHLGWLFIESERHVPYVTDLADQEAAALGRLRTRLTRALRDVLGAEFVLTFVLGLGVAHFHEHLVPRMPNTSGAVPWHASAEALPTAGHEEVARLAERLARELGIPEG